MLKKLLKYDFLSLRRFLIPLYSLTPVLALLAGLLSWIATKSDHPLVYLGLQSIYWFSTVALVLSAALLPVLLVVNYYKGMYSDAGYLTLLLPVKRRQLLFSKLLCTVISLVAYIVVAFFSFGFAFFAGAAAEAGRNPFYAYVIVFTMIGDFLTTAPINAVLLVIEGLLYLFVLLILEFSNYYFGVTLGAVVFQGKGKIWGGILFCIVTDVAVSTLLSLVNLAVSGGILAGGADLSSFESTATLQVFLILGIVLRLGVAVLINFFNIRMTEKKLNLG